jgi:hypothetical protein
VVEDLKAENAFDGVLEGVQFVAHVASPMGMKVVSLCFLF